MFVVDGGAKGGVEDADRNVEKGDRGVRDSTGEVEGRMERLNEREERVKMFAGERGGTDTVVDIPTV